MSDDLLDRVVGARVGIFVGAVGGAGVGLVLGASGGAPLALLLVGGAIAGGIIGALRREDDHGHGSSGDGRTGRLRTRRRPPGPSG